MSKFPSHVGLRTGSMPDLPSMLRRSGGDKTPGAGAATPHAGLSTRASGASMAPRRMAPPSSAGFVPPNTVQEVAQQSMLANDVYDRYAAAATSTGKTPGWRDISSDHEALGALGLSPADLQADSPSGFRSRVYAPEPESGFAHMKPQVVFCGTKDAKDLKANLQQGLGLGSRHHDQASAIGRKVGASGAQVQFVGHSLGGGLASVASMTSGGMQTTTFNAAGVHDNTIDKLRRAGQISSGDEIVNYHRQGEALGSLQRNRYSPMPESMGHSVSVPHLAAGDAKPGSLAGHGIELMSSDLLTAGPDLDLRHNPRRTRIVDEKPPLPPRPASVAAGQSDKPPLPPRRDSLADGQFDQPPW